MQANGKLITQSSASRPSRAQVSAPAQQRLQTSQATSERPKNVIGPELAKCYDEIDQIYDYIRGLAPLPIQLRKIKSIDFEQLEQREKLLKQQQQQVLATGAGQAPSKPSKVRQRDANESFNENLKVPTTAIKVTKANYISRPVIKRVESLNLSQNLPPTCNKTQLGNHNNRLLLIKDTSGNKLGDNVKYSLNSNTQFRLPRAHSTSTLNATNKQPKSRANKLQQLPGTSQNNANLADRSLAKPAGPLVGARTNTLPGGLLSSRRATLDEAIDSFSLSRLQQQQHSQLQRPADLIESFVDDDQASSSTSASATSSNQSGSSSRNSSANLEPNLSESASELKRPSCERSHSDYENTDSISSSEGGQEEPEHQAQTRKLSAKLSHRRNSSSGHGTANDELQTNDEDEDTASDNKFKFFGSREVRGLNKNVDDSQKEPAARTKTEHIYEQIPAHKNLVREKPNTAQAKSLAPRHLDQINLQPSSQRQRLAGPHLNYPMIYATNMAILGQRAPSAHNLNSLHSSNPSPINEAFAALSLQRRLQQKSLNENSSSNTRSSKKPILPHQQQLGRASAQTGPDLRHHRLSMSNLHLLPHHNQQQQQQPLLTSSNGLGSLFVNQQSLMKQKSSSSTRVNLDASTNLNHKPGVQIFQVARMRHSVQLQPQQQAPANNKQQQLKRASVNRQPIFLWPPTSAERIKQTALINKHFLQGRVPNQNRRLTAIGIEDEVLANCIKQQQQHNNSKLQCAPNRQFRFSEQQRQQEARIASELNASSQSRLTTSSFVARNQPRGYFEPPQLVRAPLIDDEQNSSTGSEEEGSANEANLVKNGNKLRQHLETGSGETKTVATNSNNRCLNSISDLHSFSSNSSKSTTDSSTKDETNFVSSRSFIKCYYGQENLPMSPMGDEGELKKASQKSFINTTSNCESSIVKKRPSDKLLGLIGLQSGSEKKKRLQQQQRTNREKASKENSTQSITSPLAAMFVSAKQAPSIFQKVSRITSRDASTNQEPMTLDTGFGGGRKNSSLFDNNQPAPRHFEYPTVKVANVPASFTTISSSKSLNSNSLTDPLHQRFLNMLENQQAGSTNTTNSTSSYDAAIKNHSLIESVALNLGERDQPKVAPQIILQRKVKAAPANLQQQHQQNLIKVPKLSKQSHLLNRPLPKPPMSSSNCPIGGTNNNLPNQHKARTPFAFSDHSLGRKQGLAPISTNLGNKQSLTGPSQEKANRAKSRPIQSTNLDHSFQNTLSTGESLKSRSSKSSCNETKKKQQQANLAPLNVSTIHSQHHSPTVTTCTSSGISSRLTAATHLQSCSGHPAVCNTSSLAHQKLQVDNFALMDADTDNDDDDNDEAPDIDERQSNSRSSVGSHSNSGERTNELVEGANLKGGNKIENKSLQPIEQVDALKPNKRENSKGLFDKSVTNNLKLFDEKFSNKFLDNQDRLASSNDSLLESINYSGTLGRTSNQMRR